jgi:hypothetical protein
MMTGMSPKKDREKALQTMIRMYMWKRCYSLGVIEYLGKPTAKGGAFQNDYLDVVRTSALVRKYLS